MARRAAVPAEPGLPRPRNRRDRPGGVDLADAVVVPMGDVEATRPVHRHAIGRVDPRLSCRTAVSAETELPRARHGRDRPSGVDLADTIIATIGDVEVARSVCRHAIGRVDLRLSRGTVISAETEFPRARHGRDRPGGVDLADAVAAPVGDVEVARPVYRHGLGSGELRLSRRSAVSTGTEPPSPRHGRDRPGGIDLADEAVAGIGDVEVARSVHRHACGPGERRLARRSAVSAGTTHPRYPRHGRTRPRGIDLEDAVVASVGDIEVARSRPPPRLWES